MHDALGRPLKAGDMVLIPCVVTDKGISSEDPADFCNIALASVLRARPNDNRADLFLNSSVMLRANPGDNWVKDAAEVRHLAVQGELVRGVRIDPLPDEVYDLNAEAPDLNAKTAELIGADRETAKVAANDNRADFFLNSSAMLRANPGDNWVKDAAEGRHLAVQGELVRGVRIDPLPDEAELGHDPDVDPVTEESQE